MTYRKKLIEVALPLKAINEASAKEKSIRHGHPSTLHLWWARRPLAACRAVLFASLVDDPDSDPAYMRADGTVDEERAGIKRAELFNLIEELVQWENSHNPRVINKARAEIARCVASRKIELEELNKDTVVFGEHKGEAHSNGPVSGKGVTAWEVQLMLARSEVVDEFLSEHALPVLDPFSGGGSIPLEAQRLGLRAYGTDLNPVAVLMTKALIEVPRRFSGQPPMNPDWTKKSNERKAASTWQGAQGLAEDVFYFGNWMRDEAEQRIGHLYPKLRVTEEIAANTPGLKDFVADDLTVIAWLWARTVPSPNPTCQGTQVPLVKSFWLSTKKGSEAWVKVTKSADLKEYSFVVKSGVPDNRDGPPNGTVDRRGGRCLLTDTPMPFPYIRQAAKEGKMGARLLAKVVVAGRKRYYISPSTEDCELAALVTPEWKPSGEMPKKHRNFQPPVYGMYTYGDLFTGRQLVSLNTLCQLVREVHTKIASHDKAYADAVALYLGEAVSKTTAFHCTLAAWRVKDGKSGRAFGRQAIPMVWDYAEVNPFADAGGSWNELWESAKKTIALLPAGAPAEVRQHNATQESPYRNVMISTDPPYYDNVQYADLSDFYYEWLRHCLQFVEPELFATMLTPKSTELVAAPHRHRNKQAASDFFEEHLTAAFKRMVEALASDTLLTVYYAFKQTESSDDGQGIDDLPEQIASTGWETMLEGLIASGLAVLGTWPLRTESTVGLKNRFNALASSILLVCRPKEAEAGNATRKEFIQVLRHELPDAVRNLQHGNIAPVDLAQAAIGPGMAIFTRYAKVIESDGSPMTVRPALGIINQVLDEVLAEQEGDFDADTRWALAWFEQFGIDEGPFGVAETLSKAKNTAVNGLVEAGIINARGGKVRIIRRDELNGDWDPTADRRLTVWEVTQHLIRILETEGETVAAALVNNLGGMAETARELAYRLYSICERNKWADEALAYNGLVIAWPELFKLSLAERSRPSESQQDLF